jgi:hypothetical protein
MKGLNKMFQKRSRSIPFVRMVSLFLLLLFAFPILAQDENDESSEPDPGLDLFDEDVERTKEGWPQFYLSVGFMYLDADGIITARLPDGNDVTIFNFERAGIKETDSSYWFTLKWRSASSRWGAWFGSWRYDVDGARIWEDQLEVPGVGEIPVGASVSSEFDAQWYILEATYSLFRSETVDAGIGLGVHAVDLDTTLSARVQVGDREVEVVSGSLDTLAPLPNFVVYATWKFSPRWLLVARMGYFTLDYDKYSGDMVNAHGLLTYGVSPRWSLGFGYQFVELDLDIEKTDYVEAYDIDFAGPMAFVRFRF